MKPWREIVSPHQDVLKGTFQDSEFSADLSTVYTGKASPEYQDPVKFFDRTYITAGMRQLLGTVIKRLTGGGGDPVIELQTNFGGGKTHSLLAVYHLATRKGSISELSGISNLVEDMEIESVPRANCAVIDGNSLSPNQAQFQQNDLTIKTMWGLLAWQLLGQEGYDMVAPSDESGTAPGKPILTELLQKAAPCVILMDELVAYIRQFENKENLCAGTFESNISFIQNLTESVKTVDKAILLASLPQSDIEAGGAYGDRALKSLEMVFGRVESIWKPVATDEGFEIVRRRLFEKVHDEESMNAVCEEYMQFYREQMSFFPSEVQLEDYHNRMKKSYPIHPEVFDRLYKDWSTLEKFQSTRGVLQYMATVIYQLWGDNNQDALIMPGSIPQANMAGQNFKYLTRNWNPIVEEEVDGDSSVPAQIDNKDTRFGSIQAARRITRTIFLGSAPDESFDIKGRPRPVRGLRQEQILLGCAIPGQKLPVYIDALSQLRDQLHHLFVNGSQFWFDTQQTLRGQMEYRKEKIDPEKQLNKFHAVARKLFNNDPFLTVYLFPASGAEVPDWDQDGLQLVVFPPKMEYVYEKSVNKTLSEHLINILDKRGEQARIRRNRLVFLTMSSSNAVKQLCDVCNELLAWEEIKENSDAQLYKLSSYQEIQLKDYLEQARKRLEEGFKSLYNCLLIPKEGKQNQVDFTHVRLETHNLNESIVQRVSTQLINSEDIIPNWNPDFLSKILKDYYFSKGKQCVFIDSLWDDFCKYYYFPRIMSLPVLEDTIAAGVEKRLFGYATSQTESDFNSFEFGKRPQVVDRNAIIIAPETAFEYERKLQPVQPPVTPGPRPVHNPPPNGNNEKSSSSFYLDVVIPASGGVERFEEILDGIVMPFNNQAGVTVKLTLSIKAYSDQPFDKNSVVRPVKENSRQLGLDNGFEEG